MHRLRGRRDVVFGSSRGGKAGGCGSDLRRGLFARCAVLGPDRQLLRRDRSAAAGKQRFAAVAAHVDSDHGVQLRRVQSKNSQNCATTIEIPNDTVNYISTGSGIGVQGIYSHNPQVYGQVNQSGAPAYYPSVQYGLSDYGIVDADVNIYNNGGTEGSGSSAATVVAPNVTPEPASTATRCSSMGH